MRVPPGVGGESPLGDQDFPVTTSVFTEYSGFDSVEAGVVESVCLVGPSAWACILIGPPRVARKSTRQCRNTISVQPGVVEKIYRSIWSRKGDVFNLLLSLAITLGRVWPKSDEREVRADDHLIREHPRGWCSRELDRQDDINRVQSIE